MAVKYPSIATQSSSAAMDLSGGDGDGDDDIETSLSSGPVSAQCLDMEKLNMSVNNYLKYMNVVTIKRLRDIKSKQLSEVGGRGGLVPPAVSMPGSAVISAAHGSLAAAQVLYLVLESISSLCTTVFSVSCV
jgi:hypothetical protein